MVQQVAIIGAGFGGVGMGYYLNQAGITDYTIFEKAHTVGGTWRENTYPGSGCDVPSHMYSYSFEPHYPWAWRYARQAQILQYIHHVADKYGVTPKVRCNTAVIAARFDPSQKIWTLSLADGTTYQARVLISAVGQLHQPIIPNIPGRDSFAGKTFHSAQWDHQYPLADKRVAVIGTGASAIQFVPEIAKEVAQLAVFQRSPGWIIPKAEREFSAIERKLLDKLPLIHDLDRGRIYGQMELLGLALQGNKAVEAIVKALALTQLRRQIPNKALREKLTPDYPIGCKRVLLSNAWLPTFNRSNVQLVTEGISHITPTGVCTKDGAEIPVDAIIWGTGFAATDFLQHLNIDNGQGHTLKAAWAEGAEAYLGITVAGFSNFGLLYGPNTNLGSGSIIYMLERQQRYLVELIRRTQDPSGSFTVHDDAHQRYNQEVQARIAQTTFSGNCQSWYKLENGKNTNNWFGSMGEYDRRTARVAWEDYLLA